MSAVAMITPNLITRYGKNASLLEIRRQIRPGGAWNFEDEVQGWSNKNPAAIQDRIARVMWNELQKPAHTSALQQTWVEGYQYLMFVRGYHQPEMMMSRPLARFAEVRHLTVQFFFDQNFRRYRTFHLYFTASGEFAGATLWDRVDGVPTSSLS